MEHPAARARQGADEDARPLVTRASSIPEGKELAPPERPAMGRRGRPEGTHHNLREDILDAAEFQFATFGFAGTTLRDIAARIDIAQGLISYYFSSKQQLFEAVFLRRSTKIADARTAAVRALRASDRRPTVDALVLAFLRPTFELRDTPGGRAFIHLQARLHTEPPEISYALRNDAYDASTQEFIDALCVAMPALPRTDVYWRVTLMVGAYLYAFSDTHRLDQLAPGVCSTGDASEALRQISAFVTSGLTATATPSAEEPPPGIF